MSHIPENLEWAKKCKRNLAQTLIRTLFNELPVDGVTAPKHVRTLLM